MGNRDVLKGADFVRIPQCRAWANRDRRMAFSEEALDDHDSQWLKDNLAEKVAATDFVFYWNDPPDQKTCREIQRVMGLPTLQPIIRGTAFRSR